MNQHIVSRVAIYILAIALLAFGIQHFLHPYDLLIKVPDFLPGGMAWVYGVGVAFILAGQAAATNATGSGYAVVLGQSLGTDPVRLVRYTAGITGNGTLTNIITSNTAGLTDFGAEYLSVRVTYNPCNGDHRTRPSHYLP